MRILLTAALLFSLSSPVTAAPAVSCKHLDVEGVIAEVDANQDGRLSDEEWRANGLPESSFAGLSKGKDYVNANDFRTAKPPTDIDANGDCVLTLEEFRAYDRKMSASASRPPERPKPLNEMH